MVDNMWRLARITRTDPCSQFNQSIHHNHKQFSVDLSQQCPPKSAHLSSGHLMMLYQKMFQKTREEITKVITRKYRGLF